MVKSDEFYVLASNHWEIWFKISRNVLSSKVRCSGNFVISLYVFKPYEKHLLII